MSGLTIFLLAVVGFITVSFIVTMMYATQTEKAKIKSTNEEGYRKLATDATDAQKETVQLNEKLVTEMEEMKERLGSIERILKEVE